MYNYNKKSKVPAILAIVTAALLIVMMVMMALLFPHVLDGLKGEDDAGAAVAAAFAAIFILAFALIGYVVFYISAVVFVIVGLIFGTRMLREPSRKRLISMNVRMLITSIVLAPFLTVGGAIGSIAGVAAPIAPVPTIVMLVTAAVYVAGIVAQIVTIGTLKRMPAEEEPIAGQWTQP